MDKHDRSTPSAPAANGVEGEGSYTATDGYARSIGRFMEAKGDHIEDFARDARDAVEGEEAEDLEAAEREAMIPARK
jgi:hypothetical protein